MIPDVIFIDLDETLLQGNYDELWKRGHTRYWQQHTDRFDVPLAEFLSEWERVESLHFVDCHERRISHEEFGIRQVMDLSAALGVTITRDEAAVAWAEVLSEYLEGVEIYDDVIPCLDAVSDYRLAVLTSGIPEWQRQKCNASGLTDRFETILTPEETNGYKPDPQVFTNACRLMDGDPKKCINVGDLIEKDVLAAEKAGLRGIWINRDGAENAQSVVEINSMRELLEVISALN